MSTRAVILAGGEGTRLGVLTAKRAKPAVPFAGKYRIIDFPLSNCVNSSIFDVTIITQYLPQSLIHHIGSGGPWDLNREFTGGIKIFTPFKAKGINWFSGTADAVLQNLNYILSNDPEYVLVLSGDQVYSMDFRALLRFHQEMDAEVSVCVHSVPLEQASRFGVIETDDQMRIQKFTEKPEKPTSVLANMGIYLFNAKVLKKYLLLDEEDQTSQHDFGRDVLPAIVQEHARIFAFPYRDYWVDVGTIQTYWKAHMDLLSDPPLYDIRKRSWVIHTRSEERPPAYIHPGAYVNASLICDGCIIEPDVEIKNSVISPGVIVQRGTKINESIILTDTMISPNASIQKAIIDKHVFIGKHCVIGSALKKKNHISMVGKNAILPEGVQLEGGGMVGCDVAPRDFSSLTIHFGEVILPKGNKDEI
ncbi:MAG TPA: sugar phosphate nucleotidyltransferase [Anaerolineaceae bacterium]|jgi:glucose-1-phosphate adenylyltransferase|nr:sugar phosphate nucleotidyltransferase [Anaerolineaceae bacterium]